MNDREPAAPLRVFDLFSPGRADPVLEAEVATANASGEDPRSYASKVSWREQHPDLPSPVRRTGSVLGALYEALGPEHDTPGCVSEPEPEAGG